MEAEVSTLEEAEVCHKEALTLADDLDTMWIYVAGMPLFPTRTVLAIRESPNGWRTNLGSLRDSLPMTQTLRGRLRIVPGKYGMQLPYMPLKRALAAVRRYRAADENSRELIDLHIDALRRQGSNAGLFLLAKALELARVMLPGNTDESRQRALPGQVISELNRDLHWMYGIANTRLEIRHVVDKKAARSNQRALLPKLDQAERNDFVHDADLVIRGVVERELGIEAAVIGWK